MLLVTRAEAEYLNELASRHVRAARAVRGCSVVAVVLCLWLTMSQAPVDQIVFSLASVAFPVAIFALYFALSWRDTGKRLAQICDRVAAR